MSGDIGPPLKGRQMAAGHTVSFRVRVLLRDWTIEREGERCGGRAGSDQEDVRGDHQDIAVSASLCAGGHWLAAARR